MARNHPKSFSAGRRWGIFFSVIVSIAAVAALTGMLNYLGARHFLRFYWSAKTSHKLSPATLGLLDSITNDVKVILYYDKTDALYPDLADLFKEYHLANPKISVRTVDYLADPNAALPIKAKYRLEDNKNLIVYDCNEQDLVRTGELLARYSDEIKRDGTALEVNGQPKVKVDRHITQFDGEAIVDADLIRMTRPALQAYYLVGDGEFPLTPAGEGKPDYSAFGAALANTHIQTATLSLVGTNTIPADCNLLIIAGPQQQLSAEALEKIRVYLAQGGRLFVLFNSFEVSPVDTGLESILARDWGVRVGLDSVKDPDNAVAENVIAVTEFNPSHPCISPLIGSKLILFSPRSISSAPASSAQNNDAPALKVLAMTGPKAVVHAGNINYPPERVPVIVAVEKKNAGGAVQRGTTRIVVAGDAYFLAKGNIDVPTASNAEFAELAAGWLLEQTQLLAGVPTRNVVDYRVMLTHAEMTSIQWIFLAAMPGGILVLGWLVWLRRRH